EDGAKERPIVDSLSAKQQAQGPEPELKYLLFLTTGRRSSAFRSIARPCQLRSLDLLLLRDSRLRKLHGTCGFRACREIALCGRRWSKCAARHPSAKRWSSRHPFRNRSCRFRLRRV